ncbi:SDR family oxidoreductase [Fulvivirga sp. 29W222]|uniref:SDR family oxidoreductase n=1 Tax=Fulvivirga marina TaxID=2494733 RepID=A0A937G1Q9_9BACT|nr:SDR family oxidoreductase [Fulvivirga marina]MBL6448395.1 SDR family oxidoreductase [Fulvivirga marina]
MNLKDKVAMVCAASRGIGFGIAKSMLQQGAKVIICSRHENDINKAVNSLKEETGGEVHGIVTDLTKSEQIEQLQEKCLAIFPQIHILVYNNGGPKVGEYDSLSPTDWVDLFENHFINYVKLISKFITHFQENNYGRIVNITSITAKEPHRSLVLSNVLRSCIHAYSKSIIENIAQDNITINNLLPGIINTDRVRAIHQVMADKEEISTSKVAERFKNLIPSKNLGTIEDVGDMCAFLTSENARYITGQSILIDGGLYKGLY